MDPQNQSLSMDQVNAIHLRIRKTTAAKNGAGWFYWIAGLSLINSLAILGGVSWNFLAGLGITQVVDGFAIGVTRGAQGGLVTAVKVVALFLDLFFAGMFVTFGFQARKRRQWAFVVGLAIYVLDALILMAFKEWFGFLFHIWALLGIWGGFQAARWLEANQALPMEPSPSPALDGATPEAAQP